MAGDILHKITHSEKPIIMAWILQTKYTMKLIFIEDLCLAICGKLLDFWQLGVTITNWSRNIIFKKKLLRE